MQLRNTTRPKLEPSDLGNTLSGPSGDTGQVCESVCKTDSFQQLSGILIEMGFDLTLYGQGKDI